MEVTRGSGLGRFLPELVVHADWGSEGKKRWMAVAVREGGRYTARTVERVGPLDSLLARLRDRAGPAGGVFLGFDFPVGLPAAYARRAGISNFPAALPQLGRPPWEAFFLRAAQPDQVSIGRPFYPLGSKKGSSRAHLVRGLGCESMADLLRTCERATPTRRDACPLFWTLGGNQVGPAAIIGWRDVLAPAARDAAVPLALWPFQGGLADLLAPDRIVVAETYPTEFYGHLGVAFPTATRGQKSGKRVQAHRAANAATILKRAADMGVAVEEGLRSSITDGFGPGKDGEDPFDAVVGLFGMLNVLLGHRPPGEPDLPEVRAVEGWILGQAVQRPPGGVPS